MGANDTDIGGPAAAFPETHISAIRATADASPAVRQTALAALVAGYWKPIYKHIRRKWNAGNEQAKDLTQGFFVEAFDRDLFARFDPARAAFRTYVRTCVDGFVANAHTADQRLKRGGGQAILSLDFDAAESELLSAGNAGCADADTAFEREWTRALFGRAIDALRTRCAEQGWMRAFDAFVRYDLYDGPKESRPTYAEIAEALRVPLTTVTNDLALARRVFRGFVLTSLRQLTADDNEYRDEARRLLGADSV